MKATLERYGHGKDSTLGRLIIPGKGQAFTLEDEYREVKKKHETRIPAGLYDVELRTVGGFHKRYFRRFPDIHRGMLHLRKVEGFQYILVHCGNDDDDTSGCILVGEVPAMLPDGEFQVLRSADAYKRIYPPLADAVESEGLQIELRDLSG